MNIGTIGQRGLLSSSLLRSTVIRKMMSELEMSPATENPPTDNQQKQFSKTTLQKIWASKEQAWITKKTKMYFKELAQIEKEKVDIDLMTSGLKDEHKLFVKKIFNILLNDDNVSHVNNFSSWTNQYLAQLIQAVASWYMLYIDETVELIVNDRRQRVNYNNLCTIRNEMFGFYHYKPFDLTVADEGKNTYPISKVGVTHLKEFSKIITRFENSLIKVKEFSKNKSR